MKISVLGPAGSYSEVAARIFFDTTFDGHNPDFLFCSSIENAVLRLFEEDENGQTAACTVIPIENSIEGAVGVSMDLLLEKDVVIIAELVVPVNHCLLVSPETAQNPKFSPEQITTVYSHPQGLYQCRAFIQSHLKNASLIETDSTSNAAMRVSEVSKKYADGQNVSDNEDQSSGIYAAIASAEAGKTYGLEAINCQIQDNPGNSTRFVFLIRSESLPCLKDHTYHADVHILPEILSQTGSGRVFYKTSIVTSPPQDKPGALFQILEAFYKHNINLTRIESRPSKKSLGEYHFYIDFEGNPSDKNVSDALKLVEERSTRLKILGTYGRILSNRQ